MKKFIFLISLWLLFTITTVSERAFARPDGDPVGWNGYWDLFAVNLTPNGFYWNQVNGGNGALADPLVSPDPAGNAVIDTTTPLGGVAYGFGGLDWGNGTLEFDLGTYSIQLVGASSYYLSVVLDTKTSPDNDMGFPSWGTIFAITVRPGTPGNWGDPIALNNWVVSPFDPDGGTVVEGGTDSTVTLGLNQFGAAEGAKQAQGIWGTACELPTAPGYEVDFRTSVFTWDSYNNIPEPATIVLLGLGGLLLRRRKN